MVVRLIVFIQIFCLFGSIAYANDADLRAISSPPASAYSFDYKLKALERIIKSYENQALATKNFALQKGAKTYTAVVDGAIAMEEWASKLPEKEKRKVQYKLDQFKFKALQFANDKMKDRDRQDGMLDVLPRDFDLARKLTKLALINKDNFNARNEVPLTAGILRDVYPQQNFGSDLFMKSLPALITGSAKKEALEKWFVDSEKTPGHHFAQVLGELGNSKSYDDQQAIASVLEDETIAPEIGGEVIRGYEMVLPESSNRGAFEDYFMKKKIQDGLVAMMEKPGRDYRLPDVVKLLDRDHLIELAGNPARAATPYVLDKLANRYKEINRPDLEFDMAIRAVQKSTHDPKDSVSYGYGSRFKIIFDYLKDSTDEKDKEKILGLLAELAGKYKRSKNSFVAANITELLRKIRETGDPYFKELAMKIALDEDFPEGVRHQALHTTIAMKDFSGIGALAIDGSVESNKLLERAIPELGSGGGNSQILLNSLRQRSGSMGLSEKNRRSLNLAMIRHSNKPAPKEDKDLPPGHSRIQLLKEQGKNIAHALEETYKLDGANEIDKSLRWMLTDQMASAATELTRNWKLLLDAKKDIENGKMDSLAVNKFLSSLPIKDRFQEKDVLKGYAIARINNIKGALDRIKENVKSMSHSKFKQFANGFHPPPDFEERPYRNLSESPWKTARLILGENRVTTSKGRSGFYCDPNAIARKLIQKNDDEDEVGCETGENAKKGSPSAQPLPPALKRMLKTIGIKLNKSEEALLTSLDEAMMKALKTRKNDDWKQFIKTLPYHVADKLKKELGDTNPGISNAYKVQNIIHGLMIPTLQAQKEVSDLSINYHAREGLNSKEVPDSFYRLGNKWVQKGVPADILLKTFISAKSNIIDQTITHCLNENPDGGFSGLLNSGLEDLIPRTALAEQLLNRRFIKKWLETNHGVNSGSFEEFSKVYGRYVDDKDRLRKMFFTQKRVFLLKSLAKSRFESQYIGRLAMRIAKYGQDLSPEDQRKLEQARADSRTLFEQIEKLGGEYPDLIDLKETEKWARMISEIAREQMDKVVDENIKKNNKPDAWYMTVLKAIPRAVEAAADLIIANAATYGTMYFTGDWERSKSAGASVINFNRDIMNNYLGGSIFGTDLEFANSSLMQNFFAVNPLGQVGKGIGGILQGVDDGYVWYASSVTGMSEEQTRKSFEDDWLMGAGYASLQVSKFAAGTALAISTGTPQTLAAELSAAGQVWAVAGGMSLVGSVGTELTIMGNKNQDFGAENALNILKNTAKGTADSVFFMGAMKLGVSQIGGANVKAMDLQARANLAAQQAFAAEAIDIIEGMGELDSVAKLWGDAHNAKTYWGAALTTAVSLFDLGGDAVLSGVIANIKASKMPTNAEILEMASNFRGKEVTDIEEAKHILLVATNSVLDDDARIEAAAKVLGLEKLSKEQAEALLKAHEKGDAAVFEYSYGDLLAKSKILEGKVDGKSLFDQRQREILLRTGLAGRPPNRTLVQKEAETIEDNFDDMKKKDFGARMDALKLSLRRDRAPTAAERLQYALNGSTPWVDTSPDTLDALYFVDYAHALPGLVEFSYGHRDLNGTQIRERYEKAAFDNYQEAMQVLKTIKPEINFNTFKQLHRELMKGGIEGLPQTELGEIRSQGVFGNVPVGHEISEKTLAEINSNPYLNFIVGGRNANGVYGKIIYPEPLSVKKELLDRIRTPENAAFLEDIEELQRVNNRMNEMVELIDKSNGDEMPLDKKEKLKQEYEDLKLIYKDKIQIYEKLQKKLVEALVDERMRWFTRQRTEIGDIDSPAKIEQLAELAADFQRDLVAIHPFANGNGRATRMMALYYPLLKEGLPLPRIADPNQDIYRSQEEWRTLVKKGVIASHHLVEDLTKRVEVGLPVSASPELLTIIPLETVQLTLRKQKGKKREGDAPGREHVDSGLYRELMWWKLMTDKAFSEKLTRNPDEATRELQEFVEDFVKKNSLYYDHKKEGRERIEIVFADRDFMSMFGVPTYGDKARYDFKMSKWYKDQIIWRGLADTRSEKSEGEIVDMFRQLNNHMASNNVLRQGPRTPQEIREAAIRDMQQYNRDILDGGLVEMATDHSQTGPKYGTSYGYSTSKERHVGLAFAMGAMVVADYGKHKTPEAQALLKSRVLVGARAARKDVDLNRLKQLRPEYSNKYGRQQEIMGIGAADPDSIEIVQTIDDKGEVMLSYLRDPASPNIILVVKGDAQPGVMPSADKILKRMDLSR